MIKVLTIPGAYLQQGGLLYNESMTKKSFRPFEHDDLELKNNLITYARAIAAKEEAEAQLASAMVFSSFAEYVSGHLLDTLRHLVYQTTYNYFAGILFIDQRNTKEVRTINKMVGGLKGYQFPDREKILELLEKIAKSRNNLFHNFAKSDIKGFEGFDEDILIIRESTEELLTKVNIIYTGLQKVLTKSDDITETSGKKEKSETDENS
jgi:hypothetical protein